MLEVFIIPFDENCTAWCTDEEVNLFFINYQKEYLRAVLKTRGWLTVADVISAFGAPINKNIKYYQYGWDVEEARKIWNFGPEGTPVMRNILLEATKGV